RPRGGGFGRCFEWPSGRSVPEMPDRPDLREVIHGEYRIIYRVEPERVSILTVRHARRLLDPTETEDDE
ncbi:MAG: type II toxin-antitoxin system RelE/ParE family toxin, partial [Rubrobacteraceae bacterium]